MNSNEYINKLLEYTKMADISIYEYFYKLGELCHENKEVNIVGFEKNNPFLTAEDYKKIYNSDEERIVEYFAMTMTRVIELNLASMKKDNPITPQGANKIIKVDPKAKTPAKVPVRRVASPSKVKTEPIKHKPRVVKARLIKKGKAQTGSGNKITTPTRSKAIIPVKDKPKGLMPIGNQIKSIVPVTPIKKKEIIEKKRKYVSPELIINTKDNSASQQPKPKKVTATATPVISRDDIKSVLGGINVKKTQPDNQGSSPITREDILDVLKDRRTQISIPLYNETVSDSVHGLRVTRDDEHKLVYIHSFTDKNNISSDKCTYRSETIKSAAGDYIHIQDYFDKLEDHILTKYVGAEEIKILDQNNQEKSYLEVVKDTFNKLRESGAIRIGKEYYDSKISSYDDYSKIIPSSTQEYAGMNIHKGIYVRKDSLEQTLSNYRFVIKNYKESEDVKKNIK